jgi:hypothetical protein
MAFGFVHGPRARQCNPDAQQMQTLMNRKGQQPYSKAEAAAPQSQGYARTLKRGVELGRAEIPARRRVMAAGINTGFRVGILTAACLAVVLPLAGCQSSDQAAMVSQTNPACPLCGRAAQVCPLDGLQCTEVVCPICGQVSTVDPQFLERLEIFTGGPIGDTVYACANCRAIVAVCATCRHNGGSATSRNVGGWQ